MPLAAAREITPDAQCFGTSVNDCCAGSDVEGSFGPTGGLLGSGIGFGVGTGTGVDPDVDPDEDEPLAGGRRANIVYVLCAPDGIVTSSRTTLPLAAMASGLL